MEFERPVTNILDMRATDLFKCRKKHKGLEEIHHGKDRNTWQSESGAAVKSGALVFSFATMATVSRV